MDKNQNYTSIPNDVLEALFLRRFPPLHYQILLYIIRKTYGYRDKCGGHKYFDAIAVSKMARDIGRDRCKVSGALSDLEKENVIEVRRTGSKKGHEMRVKHPDEWEQTVTKTSHVSKSSHVTKTSYEPLRKRHTNRDENVTHKIKYTKENNTKETPYIPHEENEGFVADFDSVYEEDW